MVTTMPVQFVWRWERVYRRYEAAFDHATRQAQAGDRDAAEAVAAASWQFAGAWRNMAGDRTDDRRVS